MGADYSVEEIPADLVDEANEWRDKMLEKVAEFDDTLMEKYFDDPSTITEEEVAQGTYANLAIITHSSSEFILDFVRAVSYTHLARCSELYKTMLTYEPMS